MEVDTSGGRWQRQASVFDSGNGRRWALAFDGGDGWQLWLRQRWSIEMACNGSGGGGVQWRQKRPKVFDCVIDGLRGDGEGKMVGTPRGQEGGARRGNATTSWHDERMRGRCNERTMRDVATTSWRNEMMRTARRRDNKRAVHREATQHPAGATRGQVGGATRGGVGGTKKG